MSEDSGTTQPLAPETPKHVGNNRAKLIFRFATVTAVYLWAYLGFSVVWIYLLLIVLNMQDGDRRMKKSKWRVARRLALGWERDVILKLHHVPSWVTFPDVDRAEWLNQIIKSLWPHVNDYMKEMIKTSIEPSLPNYLEFDKIVIGNVPLRIDGIKVYQNNETTRKTIIMDMDIVYAGDCHITCRAYGIEGGINNFKLNGKLRVVMEPLISKIPLIGALKLYFLEEPDIDFNFASVTQVLTIAKDTVKNIIIDIINGQMLFPNYYLLPLAADVDFEQVHPIKTMATRAILRVHLIEGKELVSKDMNGKSDPYAILTLGPQEMRSKMIPTTLEPIFDEWFEFEVQEHSELNIQLMDHDELSKDEKMGVCKVDLRKLRKDDINDMWLSLTGVKSGKLHLRFQWMELTSNYSVLEKTRKESPKPSILHNAILFIHVDSARDLDLGPKSTSLPDTCALITIGNKTCQTKNIKHQTNPTWDESFTVLIVNPDNDELKIEIKDKKSKQILGETIVPIRNMKNYRDMEMKSKSVNLQKCLFGTPSLTFSLRLAILESKNNESNKVEDDTNNNQIVAENGSKEEDLSEPPQAQLSESAGPRILMTIRYSVQQETLYVVIHQALNIPITDTYVKVYLYPEKIKQKTQVIKQNANPIFDAKLNFELLSANLTHAKLEVILLTEKRAFNRGNNMIGRVDINLIDFNYFHKSVTNTFALTLN